MATMATRVERAWEKLRAELRGGVEDVDVLRCWARQELPLVSKKIVPIVDSMLAEPHWRWIFDAPLAALPVSTHALEALELPKAAPMHDPERLARWVMAKLWSVAVYADPAEGCEVDQFALEAWWSDSGQSVILVCGFGHRYERIDEERIRPWAGDDERPARRDEVGAAYPHAKLL